MASKRKPLPPLRELCEAFRYDADSGKLFWRSVKSKKSSCLVGKEIVCENAYGYKVVKLGRQLYYVHRIAYAIMHGECTPEHEIDHRNGNRSDNRAVNLRLASRRQNAANTGISSRNTSGIKGVQWAKRERKWVAKFGRRSLGYFDSKADAANAYVKFHLAEFGEFSHEMRHG